MKTIWKYPLSVEDVQTIDLPAGYKPLCVQIQGDDLCLWALVDDRAEKVTAKVIIHGTGHPADDVEGLQYVGTFQLYGGSFVGHVFMEA